jgi:hypothetical protein
MKTLILMSKGTEIMGSDKLMHVDGRFGLAKIKQEVHKRNSRYAKNFPHLVADSFLIYPCGLNGVSTGVIYL